MKRFDVSSITRDKEYDLTNGATGSKVHYLSCNPNGRKEVVAVKMRSKPNLKKSRFDIDFGELLIKGRGSKGNRVTKDMISKVEQKEVGGSTLAARKVWWDDVVRRLNDDGRGTLLGEFRGEDKILTLHQSGNYKLSGFELATKFDHDLISIEKWNPKHPVAAVYWNSVKELYYIKRFLVESSSKKVLFIPEEKGVELVVASTQYKPKIKIIYNKRLKETKHLKDKVEEINDIIDIKGLKAQGNQLTKLAVKDIELLATIEGEEWPVDSFEEPISEILEEQIEVVSEEVTEKESMIEEVADSEDVEKKANMKPPKKSKPVKDDKPVEMEWDIAPAKKTDEDKPVKKKDSSNGAKDEADDDGQITLF